MVDTASCNCVYRLYMFKNMSTLILDRDRLPLVGWSIWGFSKYFQTLLPHRTSVQILSVFITAFQVHAVMLDCIVSVLCLWLSGFRSPDGGGDSLSVSSWWLMRSSRRSGSNSWKGVTSKTRPRTYSDSESGFPQSLATTVAEAQCAAVMVLLATLDPLTPFGVNTTLYIW